jgi:hypothetical protein
MTGRAFVDRFIDAHEEPAGARHELPDARGSTFE